MSTPSHHGAAVAALRPRGEGKGVGLVRLVQVSKEHCLIEATVDGLSPLQHEVKVHEYGDLSEGGDRCVCFIIVMYYVHHVLILSLQLWWCIQG